MDRTAQIAILKKLLHYIDTGTTAMADAPWHNEVAAYTCPQRHNREEDSSKQSATMGLQPIFPGRGLQMSDEINESHDHDGENV